MGDDRPSVYEEGGKWVYRASALGNCFMGLVAGRLGMEAQDHPDWLKERFQEGTDAEPEILRMFFEQSWQGYTFVPVEDSGQDEIEIPVGTGALIRGHLDKIGKVHDWTNPFGQGREWEDDQRVVVEAKAFGPDFRKKYDKEGISAFPYYVTQLTLYMAGTGLPGVFVVGKKDDDGVVREIHDVTFFYQPPGNLADAKLRVLKVEAQASKGVLPECDMKQYPCQWYWLGGKCSETAADGKPKPVKLDPAKDAHLLDPFKTAIDLYRRGQRLEKEGRETKSTAGVQLAELVQRVVSDVPLGTDEDIERREASVGSVELPDGTVVEDYVAWVKEQTVERAGYWTRYPKIKGKK